MTTTASFSKTSLWTGRVISAICVLFLLFDSITKILKASFVVQATVKLGFSENSIVPIGLTLLVCTILYVIPRTAVIGAVLLTGYLGGAVATSVFVRQPFIFPLVFGILVWLGLYLRDIRVHVMLMDHEKALKQKEVQII